MLAPGGVCVCENVPMNPLNFEREVAESFYRQTVEKEKVIVKVNYQYQNSKSLLLDLMPSFKSLIHTFEMRKSAVIASIG